MERELEQLTSEFVARFSSTPRFFQAPGRVNLIGEHTDYNEGFVLPFAIDRKTIVASARRDDTQLNVYARDLDESATIELSDPATLRRGNWIDYVEGIARCSAERFGVSLRGADIIIASNVPIGAGLSSSAAIEIAVGHALLSLNDVAIERIELAFAGQQTEHKFVGTRSGIMDQFASVFGKKANAMLLDCRSLEIEQVPVTYPDIALAVIDTKVKHNLASSEYNTRRAECEAGVEVLQKKIPGLASLRDATTEMLNDYGGMLSEVVRRRCYHVVSENIRTEAAAEAFRRKHFVLAGKLMKESHKSLRDDYEVSCAELDFLVDTATVIDGVYGARMTGGGFGGCTVNLVETRAVENLRERSVKKYSEQFGFAPDFYIFHPADGASEITA
ncbi:MAG: galactokinase [Pyrinomonadaceae bacterium]